MEAVKSFVTMFPERFLGKGSAQIDVKISFKGRQPNKESAAKPLCRYVSRAIGPAYEKATESISSSRAWAMFTIASLDVSSGQQAVAQHELVRS